MSGSPDSPIVVGCAADDGFAMPLAVLIRSILDHLPAPQRLKLYVLDLSISAQSKERLLHSWPAERVEVHWLTVNPDGLSHLPVWGRMNIATYQRLLMGRILPPDVDRIIWLDCDAIVLEDLTRLWLVDLEAHPLAAAQDLVVPYFSSRFGVERFKEMGIEGKSPHFNAGVMLVDVESWRGQQVAEQSMEYLSKNSGQVWFWDQEALNVVLAGRWKQLDPRWNQIASVAGRWFFRPEHLDEPTYRPVVDSPWIVHWAGSIKPWKFRSGRRLYRKWYEYLDQTDWRGWRPKRRLWSVALGVYDAWGRNLLYPIEPFLLKAQRRRGR